jgi:polyphosphate kinase 2 (PPK2 family)
MWLHLTPEEQLKRFKDRSKAAHKRWKLTDEDWRNRDKWELYEEAVNDMVSRTSTTAAPWRLIAANDKRYTRVKVLQTVADAMEAALARVADDKPRADMTSRRAPSKPRARQAAKAGAAAGPGKIR